MNIISGIDSQEFVFLDVETTGLSPSMGEAICELGAVKTKGDVIIDRFQTLINPRKSIPFEVYLIHKISDDDVRQAPVFPEVIPGFLEFLRGSVICAYNAGFDMGFINSELAREGYPCPANPVVDILTMARQLLASPRYNLETVARTLEIECPDNFHRALADSIVASKIFFKLVDILKKRGPSSLKDILASFSCGPKGVL